MKSILIATDFSKAAEHAELFGVNLAKAFGAKICLFSAWQPLPVSAVDSAVYMSTEDIITVTDSQLTVKANKLAEKYDVNIEPRSKGGTVVHTILEVASEKKADLIIVGMKGSGLREWIGSTAIELTRNTRIPLIIVPHEAIWRPFVKIAMAYEKDLNNGPDQRSMDLLTALIQHFKATFIMVNVLPDENTTVVDVLEQMEHSSPFLNHLTPIYEAVSGSNVSESLNTFTNRHHIDLLAVIPHKHSFFERLFIKNTIKEIAFNSIIPVLILPESSIG